MFSHRNNLIAATLVLVAVSGALRADEGAERLEYRVKAAFLYKFAGYVEWPPSVFPRPETPITIGVAGAEAIAEEAAQLVAGRTVNNRAIVVRRVKPGESLSGVSILFVGKGEGPRLNQLLLLAQPLGILSVTESDGALGHGSVINFTVAERRVRFEISLESAEKSGLKLSSRLLAVAQQVYPGTP